MESNESVFKGRSYRPASLLKLTGEWVENITKSATNVFECHLSNPPPIKNKDQFKRLWIENKLGNRLLAWKNLNELNADQSYHGDITIRYMEPSAEIKKYSIPKSEAGFVCLKIIEEATERGKIIDPSKFYFNESADDSRLLIQGEVGRFDYPPGLSLYYSFVKDKMRTSLNLGGVQASPLQAKTLLERFLDPNSLSDIYALLDLYPDHTIEFSTYDFNLGYLPRRNTVIWEVRRY